MAVFYRTNAQSLPLETSMKFSGIPYKVVGGAKFYDRKEIKDILAYVRVLANPDDEVSARRIVNVPKRGIGDTSVARMAAWARTEGLTFSAAIDRAEEAGLTGKALKGAEALAKTLAELRPLVQTVNPADFVQLVADRTGYLAELVAEHTHEADGRIENLAELATQAGDFDDVLGFLETVALVADSDELDSDGTRVSLMTLHTAKGLEYPAVFVVGLEEGIFPHFRSLVGAERARGGAPALLRGHHPGPPAPSHFARLVADHLGAHPAGHAEPLRHRGARRTWSTTWVWARPGGEPATTTTTSRGRPSHPPSRWPTASGWRRAPVGPRARPARAHEAVRAPRTWAWCGATRWCTTTGAGVSWWRPRAKGPGPRPPSTSTRWGRRTCCCRPPRCADRKRSAH